jgi:MFS family permease
MALPNPTQIRAVAPALSERRRWVLAACCLANAATSISPPPWVFRPPGLQAFAGGWATYSLVMSALSLGALAFLLIGGVLGDIFGRRRVLLIGLGGLLVANLLTLVTRAIPWFVTMRLLAGAFGVLVLPLSLSNLFLAYADDAAARARAVTIYVLLTNTALLLSGFLGQLMYSQVGWRASFALPTLLTLAALVLARREVGESAVARERYVDVIGHAAWTLITLSLLYGLIAWVVDRTFSPVVRAASLVAIAIGVALLVWWERHNRETVIGQSRVKRRALVVLILFGLCLQFGFVGLATQVRSVLQAAFGYGNIWATAAMVPVLAGMFGGVVYAGRRLRGGGARPLMSGGLLVVAAVCALTALTGAAGSWPWRSVLLLAFGAAAVLASSAWTTMFLRALPADVVGVRTGINTSVVQVGASLGASLPAALLTRRGLAEYTQLLLAAGVPAERVDAALAALDHVLDPATPDAALVDPAVAAQLLAGHQLAYLVAFEQVLLVIALICLMGSLLAWFGLPHELKAIYLAEESEP